MSVEHVVEFQKEIHALVDKHKPTCTPLEIVGSLEFLKLQVMQACMKPAPLPAPPPNRIIPLDRLPPGLPGFPNGQ